MNLATQKLQLIAGAGAVEALLDRPSGLPVCGTAVIAHPHPLFGGAMTNKVVQTLASAFVLCGWQALRFNFRGVGASQGVYDEGRGEAADLLDLVGQIAPSGPLALAGFSFGAFVVSQALQPLAGRHDLQKIILVGTAASRFAVAPVSPELHQRTLVVHGEQDDTVPLSSVMDWARPQALPVVVIPGATHFFHGQLPLLKSLSVHHLRAPHPD